MDWKYIRQRKQAQIEKEVIHKNYTIIEHDYRVGDQVTIDIKILFKYETPFKGPYEFFKCGQMDQSPYRRERS